MAQAHQFLAANAKTAMVQCAKRTPEEPILPMKLIALACAVLVDSCPSWAQDGRFIEFSAVGGHTQIYDLSTVQIIQPGRFTIISTSIGTADVMKLELKVLNILRTYCSRPDGEYPAPKDAFALGPPDMDVKGFEVKTNPTKRVFWSYPYLRLAGEFNGKMYPAVAAMFVKSGEKRKARCTRSSAHRS